MVAAMKASVWVTLVICSFLPRSGLAARPLFADPRETFGAVRGPAQLPAGALAVYGYLGAPELGLGLRQGFEPLEAELVVRGDYLDLSFAVEALLRQSGLRAGGAGDRAVPRARLRRELGHHVHRPAELRLRRGSAPAAG